VFKVGVHSDELREESNDGEYSLDGEDNWVQASKLGWLQKWSKHLTLLDTYVQGVEGAIWMDLLSATPSHSLQEAGSYFRNFQEQEKKYSLNACEVAWECVSENPIRQVEELVPYMRQYGRLGVEVNDYRVSEEEAEYSNSVVIRLGNGNQLALYAKTNRRIRFEYRYRSDRGHKPAPLLRKTADNKAGLYSLVDEVKVIATEEMNGLFTYLRQTVGMSGGVLTSSKSVSNLYMGVLRHTKMDVENAEMILQQLENTGVVKPAHKVLKSLHESIRSMADKKPKMLDYDKSAKVYLPVEEYRWAVSQLESVGGWERLALDPLEVTSES
jgi:hypothetical protein